MPRFCYQKCLTRENLYFLDSAYVHSFIIQDNCYSMHFGWFFRIQAIEDLQSSSKSFMYLFYVCFCQMGLLDCQYSDSFIFNYLVNLGPFRNASISSLHIQEGNLQSGLCVFLDPLLSFLLKLYICNHMSHSQVVSL